MASIRCLKCGKVNGEDNDVCEKCGERLLKGQEYADKLQELEDYEAFRKRYGVSSIVTTIFVVLLMWPFLTWLISFMLSMYGFKDLTSSPLLKLVAPLTTLLLLAMAVPPMIYRRSKIGRKYGWTADRMQELDREIKPLPKDFFGTPVPSRVSQAGVAPSGGKEATIARPTRRGSPLSVLIAFVCIFLVVFFMEKYTDYKPVSEIKAILKTDTGHPEIGTTVTTVSGTYECHFSPQAGAGGSGRVAQTWAFAFGSSGIYNAYINGVLQYSGTWSQSGRTLTIKIPALPGGIPARSVTATVSSNGSSFTSSSGDKYVRVK